MNNAKNTTLFPYLERLLEGEAVEWKTLGEVAEFKRGQTITQKTAQEGVYPVISGGQQPAYYIDQYNRTGQTITVAGSGAYAGFVMFWNEPIFVSDAFSIKANEEVLLPRYVFHFLLNKQSSIFNLKRGSGVPHVYAKDLAVFSIPIPSLRVQARIVEILDKFTQLEAELEAELEARKKQYAYYRDQLLNFSQCPPLNVNIEWKTLGEVCHIVGRIGFRGYTRNDIVERGEGAISISPTNIINQHLNLSAEINTYISWEKYDESPEIKIEIGDIVLVKTGSTVGKTAIVRELIEKATINPQMVVLKEIQCSPAYLSHYINTPYFQLKLKSLCGQGSVPNISQTKLSTISIPIPPLSEQRRIVDLLDRFDTLTNSISEGLPKEIALRRKQYEYYRDALLSFPRPEATA